MDSNKSTIASDFLSIFKGLKATARGDEHFIYLKDNNKNQIYYKRKSKWFWILLLC